MRSPLSDNKASDHSMVRDGWSVNARIGDRNVGKIHHTSYGVVVSQSQQVDRPNGHGWPYPFLATSLETSLSQQELSIAANLPSFVTSREEELGIQKVWITLTGPVKA